MTRPSSINKPKGDSSHVLNDACDVDEDAASGATGTASSALPTDSSTTVSAATVRPEGFPRCRYCFVSPRNCDGGRPCSSCIKNKRTCLNVTQEDLDKHPERVQYLLDQYELQKSTTSNGKKRAAATDVPNDEQKKPKKHKTEAFKKKQLEELNHCLRAINDLLSDKYADCNVHFLDPFDHVALNLPHYGSIVEFPMDLGTMKEKLENCEYRIAREFKKDFMKVVNSARLWHEEGSEVYQAANKLEQVFDVVWEETKQSVEAEKNTIDENEG